MIVSCIDFRQRVCVCVYVWLSIDTHAECVWACIHIFNRTITTINEQSMRFSCVFQWVIRFECSENCSFNIHSTRLDSLKVVIQHTLCVWFCAKNNKINKKKMCRIHCHVVKWICQQRYFTLDFFCRCCIFHLFKQNSLISRVCGKIKAEWKNSFKLFGQIENFDHLKQTPIYRSGSGWKLKGFF